MRRMSLCLVVASLVLACDSGGTTTSPPPAPTAPTPVSPGFSFTGTVVEVTSGGRQPITGVTVGVRDTVSTGITYLSKGASVDANGRFRILGIREGRAAVSAFKDGYVQPCAVTLTMTGDTERDIELVPASAVEQATISRLGDYGSAILTGVVTGVAPGGRKAVAGASVGIEIDMDFSNATTRTDGSGRYILCGIAPEVAVLYVAAPGARGPMQSLGTIDFRLPQHRQIVERDIEIEVP
jgi:hypothetical protein